MQCVSIQLFEKRLSLSAETLLWPPSYTPSSRLASQCISLSHLPYSLPNYPPQCPLCITVAQPSYPHWRHGSQCGSTPTYAWPCFDGGELNFYYWYSYKIWRLYKSMYSGVASCSTGIGRGNSLHSSSKQLTGLYSRAHLSAACIYTSHPPT